VAREMRNRGLVNTAARVDVDSVDDLVRRLGSLRVALRLVLAGGGQQQAAIGGERQPPEERSQRLVGIEAGVLHAEASARRVGFRRRLHGHHGR